MEKGSARIMIVDNQGAIRHPLINILRQAGFRTAEAENGRQALDKLMRAYRKGKRFDLLTIEIFLPELNGLELIDQLRAMHMNLNTLVISGFRDKSLTDMLLRKGCRDFLDKPFSTTDFLKKIQTMVRPARRQLPV